MQLDRRDFLKIVGAGTASITFGGVIGNFVVSTFADEEEFLTESFRQTVCGICDSNCALRVHLIGEKAVEITGIPNGDADIPSGGKPCIKALSAYRFLYDPDRLKGPLMRTNPERGKDVDPGWKEITWDEAYSEIGKRFAHIADVHGPESIVFVTRPQPAQSHFARAIGTPNTVCHVDTCYLTHDVAWSVTTGRSKPWVWDYENANYIIGFGYDQLGRSKRVFARGLQRAMDRGAKVVIFDPKLTVTASKAAEWIPIRPGTDPAVALAMINVIISEALYDTHFVESYVHGFDDLRRHVAQYTPDWAADISDVPASVITRIAREFAAARPAVVAEHKRDAGGPLRTNSFDMARCQVILNALVGSIDRLGGPIWPRNPKMPGLTDVFDFDYPEFRTEERVDGLEKWPLSAPLRKASFSHLADGILSEKPYPAKGMLVHKYNLTSFPNPDAMIEAMKTLDTIVVMDVVLSEMAQMADFVLPNAWFLEGSGWSTRNYSAYYPQIALREGTDVLELPSMPANLNGILKGMGRDEFVVDWKAFSAAQLEAVGLTIDDVKNASDGIWKDESPHEGRTEFDTPTGKIEMFSTSLKEHGYDPLPTWRQPKHLPGAEEFYLLTTHTAWIRMGNPAQINDEMLANLQPENLCWMNAGRAGEMGISDGDELQLVSQTGAPIRLKARLIEGIRPDCLMTEHGYGHWSDGMRVAQGKGEDDGELSPNWSVTDKLAVNDPSCSSAFLDFTVTVEKV